MRREVKRTLIRNADADYDRMATGKVGPIHDKCKIGENRYFYIQTLISKLELRLMVLVASLKCNVGENSCGIAKRIRLLFYS